MHPQNIRLIKKNRQFKEMTMQELKSEKIPPTIFHPPQILNIIKHRATASSQ